MQHNLVDILRCPLSGEPLRLIEWRVEGDEVIEGLLISELPGPEEHLHAYPIIAGIPHLVRDGLRLPDREARIAKWNAGRIPYKASKTFPMSRRRRNQTDARLVDEGRHWSEFFQAYWDAGAKAIFDMKAVGTHMPWYPYGVLEPDDRDKKALYGFFPKHIGKRIFGAMSDAAKKGGGQGPDGALRALDVGCGGGQMALEAARRGMYAVGFDIAVGALELARKHARAQGEQVDYIYADPMQLPFAEGAFDFLVCKDALHHLPAVRRVVENIWRVAAPGAPIVAYEHVADTEAGSKLRERLHQRHMPKIMARYGKTEKIPEVIRSTSVNEDIGAAHVGPAVREWFDVEYERAELRMYLDIEQIYYFRYGKKRWLAKLAGTIARLSERLNRKGIEPEFLLLIGKRKENKN